MDGGKKEGRKETKMSTSELELVNNEKEEVIATKKSDFEIAPLKQQDALLAFKTVFKKVGVKESKPKVVKHNQKAFKKKDVSDFPVLD